MSVSNFFNTPETEHQSYRPFPGTVVYSKLFSRLALKTASFFCLPNQKCLSPSVPSSFIVMAIEIRVLKKENYY